MVKFPLKISKHVLDMRHFAPYTLEHMGDIYQ